MAHLTLGSSTEHVSFERERGVYGVEVVPNVAHVLVEVQSEEERIAQIGLVFRTLGDAGIPIFLIQLHSLAVSFTVSESVLPRVDECLRGIGLRCRSVRGLAIISVLAGSMRDLHGILVDIADSLQLAGARIHGMGDSHNSVQCLIPGDRADVAVSRLRDCFHLEAVDA